MATAYVVANIRVSNPEKFEEYKRLSTAAVHAHGGRFLIRGGKVVSVEGTWTPNRLTVIEFSSWENAEKFVRSAEYSQARAARRDAAFFDMIVVEGI